jgi:DNA-binding CsgD family transcriptional regulator
VAYARRSRAPSSSPTRPESSSAPRWSCSAQTCECRLKPPEQPRPSSGSTPPDEPIAPIPAAAYNIGAALIAAETDVAIGEPWSRVHLGGSRWATLRADRLGHNIAVSIEPATPAERIDLLGRASGLSARESETLTLLAAGLDNKQIAAALVVSEHTATDHVKAVLAKTGTRTRQILLARALGG